MIDAEVAEEANASVLCWLATVDPDGAPSVSPKQIWTLRAPDQVVIAEIASPNSVRNLLENPQVCVSFVDIFNQKGRKLYGVARLVEPEEPDFAELGQEVLELAGKDYPVRRLIVVEVSRTAKIRAPSYHIFPDRTPEERRAITYETYGVTPVD